MPGAAVALLSEGATATAYCGVADVTTGEPVTPETRFAVGSLTKSMVATVLARLAEDSVLSLDDPAAAHVPELRAAAWAERATVRDLLANRSGLPLRAALEFGGVDGDGDDVLARFAATIAAEEPTRVPWSYTNAGWSLLGRALETVTGRVWEDAMVEHLLVPLGMDRTTFATHPVAEPRAVGHEAGRTVEPWTPRCFGPSGTTVLSTVTDLLRLAALHLDDRGFAELRVRHADVRIHAWLDAWCLGWARFDWDGATAWGWDGLLPGQRAALRLLPERGVAVAVMTNGSDGRIFYRSLVGELMDAFGIRMPSLRLEPRPGAAGDLSRFAGGYAWADRRYVVAAAGDALLVDGPDGVAEALPVDDCTFLVDAADPDTPTVTFGGSSGDGRPAVLYQMLWGFPRVESPTNSASGGGNRPMRG